MLLIYFFNFFAKLFEGRFLIVELYWGFQTSKFKVKLMALPSQGMVVFFDCEII